MPATPARPLRWIAAGLVAAVALLFLGQHLLRDHLVTRERDQRDTLVRQAIADIGRTLPRPFDENLVADRVLFEDDTLIVVIRSTTRSADATDGDAIGLAVPGSVMASDAFFPFRDGIDAAAAAGIAAVIQPGGSMRDAEVIAAADEHGIAMVFTGVRHFRH